MRRSIMVILVVVISMAVTTAVAWTAGISNTSHDFSATSTGSSDKASSVDQICVFCHTPHTTSAQELLWNRSDPTDSYTPYSSTSLDNTITTSLAGTSSLLCLSCHDGTIAVNSVLNEPGSGASNPGTIAMTYGNAGAGVALDPTSGKIKSGRISNLGTDLSNDHPINITYDPALDTGLVAKASVDLPLPGDTVQCASCHDPHGVNDGSGANISMFLRKSNTGSALCLTCHIK